MSILSKEISKHFVEPDANALLKEALMTIREVPGAHVFSSTWIEQIADEILEVTRAPKADAKATYKGLVMALSFCIYYDDLHLDIKKRRTRTRTRKKKAA